MAVETPICDFGWKGVDFSLPGIDGKNYTLGDVAGPKGLLVMFLCNHCPYVKRIAPRLGAEVRAIGALGIGAIGIMANDVSRYPEDSLENMEVFARSHDFSFPYVIDESQETARAYGAACTPDFFGFNGSLELQYRGRLDDVGAREAPVTQRELFEAMKTIAETGQGPADQIASMGCSIKWRES